MRRGLLRQWPALTRFYGLMPWHVNELTPDELAEYVRQLADVQRERAKDARRLKG